MKEIMLMIRYEKITQILFCYGMREDNHDVEVLVRITLMLSYERGPLDS
jgi:hypothetical protein